MSYRWSAYVIPKTDVTPAIFSRNFVAWVFSHDKIASVTWRVARVFDSRALLYSVQLCWQNAERWLVSCHRCFCFASVCCTYSSFCLIYFNLFNLFDLEMEWSDAKMLQLIELYEKRPYWYAASNWTVAAYATLSCDFVAHSRDKTARENCRCDIDLSPEKVAQKAIFFIFFWNRSQIQSNEVCYKVSLWENFQRQSCSRTIPVANGP